MTNKTLSSNSLLLLAMSLGFVVVQLDVTVVNVATHTIGASVGGNIASLQWVVNAYTLAFAAIILTAGALGDRIGSKRVFMAGFALFTLASMGCGLSPTLPLLIAFRALQGIGAAILVPCSLALLNHAYQSPAEKSRAVGIWAAGASVALAMGPIVGGLLITAWGWRSIFYINVPIGALGIWLTTRYATETPRSQQRGVDIPGQATAIIALTLLAASIIRGGGQGWSSPWVLGGFGVFVLLAILFWVIEHGSKSPMLPLSLFNNQTFSATAAIGFLLNISFYGLLFILSLYFQQVRNYSPLKTGLCFLPMMCAVFASNILAGWLSKNTGHKKLILTGAAIYLGGCLWLLEIGHATAYTALAFPLTAIGFGVGLVVPPMTAAMLNSVDKSRSGLASGVLNSMRQTGSVVGVALFGSLIAQRNRFLHGLHLSLSIAAGILLLCLLFASTALHYKEN